jgi:hypothetical protein
LDQDLDLDNSWVDSYKKAECNYNEFYNEKVTTIKLFYLYIDTTDTVVNIKQEVLPLNSASMVPREQLIALIKAKQNTSPHLRYKLFSLVRFNINLLPEEINDFIRDNANNANNANNADTYVNNTYSQRFLTPEVYIQDIYFRDTISIFQDLNALYLIFKEDPNPRLKNSNARKKNPDAHKFTKKLRASIKKRYTRYKL